MLYNKKDIRGVNYTPDECEDLMIVTISFWTDKDDTVLFYPLEMWRDSDTLVTRKVGLYIKENL